jgi:hypothetical protein
VGDSSVKGPWTFKNLLTWVRGYIPTWDDIGGVEGRLFGLGEEVLYVFVESNLSERNKWVVFLRDGLGCIKDVRLVVLGLKRVDDLCVDIPRWVVALLNGVEKILSEVIRVLTTDCGRLIVSQILDALVGLEVNLDVFEGSVLHYDQNELVAWAYV